MRRISEHSKAVLDVAISDVFGLASISTLSRAKQIVDYIVTQKPLDWVVSSIVNSRFPADLLRYLAGDKKSDSKRIELLMRTLYENKGAGFESSVLDEIADYYWTWKFKVQLDLGKYQHAWDLVRKSFRGLEEDSYEIWLMLHAPESVPGSMSASRDCIVQNTYDLYQAMVASRLIREIDTSEWIGVTINDEFSKPTGIIFAIATRGYTRHEMRNGHNGVFNEYGRQVLRIAEYFTTKRNTARKLSKQKRKSA